MGRSFAPMTTAAKLDAHGVYRADLKQGTSPVE
jgi:hypothetical protein